MKKRTIYTLSKDTEISGELVAKIIKDNEDSTATFSKLESYVDDSPKMDRQAPNELLTINNFAEYITDINTGHLLGNQVDYSSTDDEDLDAILDEYRDQNIYGLDSDIGTDCSMFGQAFENVFVDENSDVISAKLSVYNTVVVYDDTFKHNKMFAVYYSHSHDQRNEVIPSKYDVTIWTPTKILYRQLDNNSLTEDPDNNDVEHYFGDVPVIHYTNNRRMKGDYESVISLIDAYNILQSDRVIDREKLVDAILAFYGASLTEDDRQAIKDNRTVGLPDGAKAEYIVKKVNEADADVLRKVIASDIHKFSKTPDLTDETFDNAPSGVSILYKLLAFEQNIKKKERQFETGLKERFDLYSTMLAKGSKLSTAIDSSTIDVIFSRSLPKNDFETSQMINNLEGTVSQQTLIGQLSFVRDAASEVKKAEAERTEADPNFATSNFPPNEGTE